MSDPQRALMELSQRKDYTENSTSELTQQALLEYENMKFQNKKRQLNDNMPPPPMPIKKPRQHQSSTNTHRDTTISGPQLSTTRNSTTTDGKPINKDICLNSRDGDKNKQMNYQHQYMAQSGQAQTNDYSNDSDIAYRSNENQLNSNDTPRPIIRELQPSCDTGPIIDSVHFNTSVRMDLDDGPHTPLSKQQSTLDIVPHTPYEQRQHVPQNVYIYKQVQVDDDVLDLVDKMRKLLLDVRMYQSQSAQFMSQIQIKEKQTKKLQTEIKEITRQKCVCDDKSHMVLNELRQIERSFHSSISVDDHESMVSIASYHHHNTSPTPSHSSYQQHSSSNFYPPQSSVIH